MDLHFCSTAEAANVLAEAGFGAAAQVPRRPRLTALRLTDAPELSFGMFYKPYPGDGMLRKFIQLAKQHFCEPDGI